MSALSHVETLSSSSLRQMMVDCQVRTFDVTDQLVLSRMLDVPREQFVPAALNALAYSDAAIAVGAQGQRRLLTPMILARLLQEAELQSHDRVLDVGGGLGYCAALVAGLVKNVVCLEESEEFSQSARQSCAALGLSNVQTVTGPLQQGYGAQAPYDVIIINGVIEQNPTVLLNQLAPHGRLVTLMTDQSSGRAIRAVRFDHYGTGCSQRWLFNASGSVLSGFARPASFQF
jgi:protein-L-isoaspartate(D-aspartate) O-methyltransferase